MYHAKADIHVWNGYFAWRLYFIQQKILLAIVTFGWISLKVDLWVSMYE